jgi:hypothetical protein
MYTLVAYLQFNFFLIYYFILIKVNLHIYKEKSNAVLEWY